ncbi:MAG: zinc metalloprotease HtpX [Candidatus Berkelbacteria bacterium]
MNLWTQVDSNKRKSISFMLIFILVVVGLGFLFSYVYNSYAILVIAVIIALVQPLVSYYSGDKIVLSMSGASEIKKSDNPDLWNIVENLAITAGLPMPKVYIIQDPMPNAFATGRDPEHASVAVTAGLMQRLDKNELQGVVAHEMSHVGNYDIRLMMIVAILVSVIALISDIFIRSRWFGFGRSRDNSNGGDQLQGLLMIVALIAAILAPFIAMIIQLAISRKREFLADASGALLTRYPEGLASALEKISAYSEPMQKVSSATEHLFIANPLGDGKKGRKQSYFSKLFSTHPPIEERIKALRGSGV